MVSCSLLLFRIMFMFFSFFFFFQAEDGIRDFCLSRGLGDVYKRQPDIHYQWEQQTGPTTWVVVGTDSPNYNTGALSITTNYRVWVNADESGCEDVYSTVVTVVVTPDISIAAQPVGGSICTGGNFDLSITASGSPDIHYQWEQQTGPTTWVVVGADSPSYNTGALSATTNYRVWVNADESGCEDVYSTIVSVLVFPDIAISAQPVGGSICTGGNFDLSV